jgi:hypothetical protein
MKTMNRRSFLAASASATALTTMGSLAIVNAQGTRPVERYWVPVTGDWDGDGKHGIGAVDLRSMTFYLRNALLEGPVDYPPFQHGNATGNCVPIVGDWDGDGKDGIGIVYLDTMTFHLRNSLSRGPVDYPPFRHGTSNPVKPGPIRPDRK